MVQAAPWPTWASYPCAGLGAALACMHVWSAWRRQSAVDARPPGFAAFQREYLGVHGLVMLADWLQGPNMYTLYQSYGMDVGKLFMLGFLSSAVASSFVGRYVDIYGRKRACLVYVALELVINVLEHVPHFGLLALGRVLGGLSTALLFSAFESWMVTEHRKRHFPEPLLSSTFALASEISGLVAIVAGIVAQIAADRFGDIAPFQVALLVTFFAGLCILRWPENVDARATSSSSAVALASIRRLVTADMLLIGLAASLYEGAMYNFVFLWVPSLQAITSPLPTGLVFASFMLCIALGGKLFAMAQDMQLDAALVATVVALVSSACLATPAVTSELAPVFTAFLLFEVCVGVFFPCSATLRAQYFGDARLSTVLSLFRLPTNVLVLLGTALAETTPDSTIFVACSGVLAVAGLCVSRVPLAHVKVE
ncbi:hypothetical protein SPRG_08489 [Saprolegnia parasitica CBS 223.65]|uniref:Molybdate-anion transporter n=1 Tax=Saprolegnia parasitica (strain CBS 223.65) TaxID=695850 RepID=A0A067C6J6_SAPPC|nr:hypothetical protein SPRG_08489 [Saprolegnia parasitica CBS 223.65]KDO26128.1 hypothetical protein SPRG_08489 [Saprolegnia parasitica CBS 223.65]|eukprot:XP_012203122.1 hypothetical protein SPRG_08489 [Saprolegnia parasitica CBS 223.65]